MFAKGWDLLDFFRGTRPWSQLVRLIYRLPADSHFQAALAMDEERGEYLAALLHESRDEDGGPPPPVSPLGYTLEAMLLLRVIDMLKVVSATMAAFGGGKPGRVESEPRPSPAVERALARLDRADVDDVLSQMLGGG